MFLRKRERKDFSLSEDLYIKLCRFGDDGVALLAGVHAVGEFGQDPFGGENGGRAGKGNGTCAGMGLVGWVEGDEEIEGIAEIGHEWGRLEVP